MNNFDTIDSHSLTTFVYIICSMDAYKLGCYTVRDNAPSLKKLFGNAKLKKGKVHKLTMQDEVLVLGESE